MSEHRKSIPAVALRGMTILPGMIAHFDVSREKSVSAIAQAMHETEEIFLVTQKEAEEEEPTIDGLYRIGMIASIKQVIKMQNNIVRVLVEGTMRAELKCFSEEEKYLLAEVEPLTEVAEDLSDKEKEAMLRGVQEAFVGYCQVNQKMSKEFLRQVQEATDLEKVMDQISNNLPVHFEQKQRILEAVTLTERYGVLVEILLNEIQIIDLKNNFQAKVKERIDKHQKEYILREQMKLIR